MKTTVFASAVLALALGFGADAMAGAENGKGHGVQGCSTIGLGGIGPLPPGQFFKALKESEGWEGTGLNPEQIRQAGGFNNPFGDNAGAQPPTVGAALDLYCPNVVPYPPS